MARQGRWRRGLVLFRRGNFRRRIGFGGGTAVGEKAQPRLEHEDATQVEWLNDFDTIQHLDRVKLADDELLAALQ